MLAFPVADPEFHNGGGRTVEGEQSGEGAAPSPEKMNFYLKWWVLVHSRITFYFYAKIGQVNGGGRPPRPLDPPLSFSNNLIFWEMFWHTQ